MIIWRPEKTAVQAKRHEAPVGNDAVQQLLGGMRMYSCEKGIVITTSCFTKSAHKLANAGHGIKLWDRDRLRNEISDLLPEQVQNVITNMPSRAAKQLA